MTPLQVGEVHRLLAAARRVPEVGVLQADPVRTDEQQQEQRFGEEQEAPALLHEGDDIAAPDEPVTMPTSTMTPSTPAISPRV